MIVTTTFNVEGHQITKYLGIVFGDGIAAGKGWLLKSNLDGIIGPKLQASQQLMEEKARSLGADAIIGVNVQWDQSGVGNIFMVGTAVKLEQ